MIRPDWERIDSVRSAVLASVAAVFPDGELRDTLAMVSTELLENAVRYGEPERDVAFSLRDDGADVLVTVSNGVDPASHHVQALQAKVTWLSGFADPLEAYSAALREVYESFEPMREASGLGIVRIHYEGRCQLSCEVSEPGRISVSARRLRSLAEVKEIA
jgi:hypothetical protein